MRIHRKYPESGERNILDDTLDDVYYRNEEEIHSMHLRSDVS
jgi:hypothetical protein